MKRLPLLSESDLRSEVPSAKNRSVVAERRNDGA
jgi:hypothetical protein